MIKILLATRNAKKLVELQRILSDPIPGRPGAGSDLPQIELVSMNDVPEFPEVPETGLTFSENALLKARAGRDYTGLPTIADDSGIVVDALNGMPGVLSARWSGRHGDDRANLELVLDQIADLPDEHRSAAFVCAAALALPDSPRWPGGKEYSVESRQSGRLLRVPRGEGGFGYDPIFLADGQSRTNAELSPAEKDAISHRGRAFRALAEVIAKAVLGAEPA